MKSQFSWSLLLNRSICNRIGPFIICFSFAYLLHSQCSPVCSGSNTALGTDAGNITLGAIYNTSLFGTEAGKSLKFANNNSFFGRTTGFNTVGSDLQNQTHYGTHNSFFGSTSGFDNTIGFDNSFFGSYAGRNNTTGAENSFFGREAGFSNDDGNDNSFFGRSAGYSNTSGDDNSFYGRSAGRSNLTGSNNSFFGKRAGYANNTGTGNSFFGKEAGESNSFGHNNSFYGISSGMDNEGASDNSFYGAFSGMKNGGFNNSFFGSGAGKNNEGGTGNCFFGYAAGEENIHGVFNNYFGQDVGKSKITGSYNCFYGSYSGIENEGSFNSLYGNYAGVENHQTYFNSFLGYRSGSLDSTAGSNNCFIGSFAGNFVHGDHNIVLGYLAGPGENQDTISNRLYIDNHQTSDPLIYGELDSHFVRINGTFEVTAGLSNPSSRSLKTDFQNVDRNEILEKIQELDIQQWVYKERPSEPHIGPVAEEFYEAFGLGADDQHISTIDADGVMMLAIQELLDLVKKQSRRITLQEKRIQLLENMNKDN